MAASRTHRALDLAAAAIDHLLSASPRPEPADRPVWRPYDPANPLLYPDPALNGIRDLWPDMPAPGTLPRGALLGIVHVTDITHIDSDRQLRENPWAQGPWCWRLRDPAPLAAPLAYIGHQGLRAVDEVTVEQLRVAYRRAHPTTPHTEE